MVNYAWKVMREFMEKNIINPYIERMTRRTSLWKWGECKVTVRVNELTGQSSICVLGELSEMQVALRVTCIIEMKGIGSEMRLCPTVNAMLSNKFFVI